MFHDIAQAIMDRMRYLEELDNYDRANDTPRMKRLRQIPPETGQFLALWAAGVPTGQWLEIGTSAGYSTMWLSLAAHYRQQKITTFELLDEKVALAQETFRLAQIEEWIELIQGDIRDHLADYTDVAFCFVDTEKELYEFCYDTAIPNLVSGGLLIADNAISHQAEFQPLLDHALSDKRVDAMIVPIGKGLLVCRKI